MAPQEEPVYERLAALTSPTSATNIRPLPRRRGRERYWGAIDAVHCKNLFMRNQKGNRHYLVILEHRSAPICGPSPTRSATASSAFGSTGAADEVSRRRARLGVARSD